MAGTAFTLSLRKNEPLFCLLKHLSRWKPRFQSEVLKVRSASSGPQAVSECAAVDSSESCSDLTFIVSPSSVVCHCF